MTPLVSPANWRPAGIDGLDALSLRAVRSAGHCLVVAGPGSGKTELLAQRAAFLLQTGAIQPARRILAVTFKKDAAATIRDRVRARCDPRLAHRFESHTFDSFAKHLVESFRPALPEELRPPERFDVATTAKLRDEVRSRVARALTDLRQTTPPGEVRYTPRPASTRDYEAFVDSLLRGAALVPSGDRVNGAAEHRERHADAVWWATRPVWTALLEATPCVITFDMLKRMAERMVAANPLVGRALQLTYACVLLDEYQDVTPMQYELLRACFGGRGVILTAVGDHRQRIMGWAGAMPGAGDRFGRDYGAERVELVVNYRSDVNLVRLQHALAAAVDPGGAPAEVYAPNRVGSGRCDLVRFADAEAEGEALARYVAGRTSGGVSPREVAVLTRQRPDQYAAPLMAALGRDGLASRLEEQYVDLLRDELVRSVLQGLWLYLPMRQPAAFQATSALLEDLGLAREGAVGSRSAAARIERAGRALRPLLAVPPASRTALRAVVREVVQRLLGGRDVLRGYFPHCYNDAEYQDVLTTLCDRLWDQFEGGASGWAEALDAFEGEGTVPVMTVHKSKGMQFDTVILVGLEDHAWAWGDEPDAEAYCTLFVALSRAKQRVVIATADHRILGNRVVVASRQRVRPFYEVLERGGVVLRDGMSVEH